MGPPTTPCGGACLQPRLGWVEGCLCEAYGLQEKTGKNLELRSMGHACVTCDGSSLCVYTIPSLPGPSAGHQRPSSVPRPLADCTVQG